MVTRSPVPLHPVPEWEEKFPWVMVGITHAGLAGDPFDLRLFGDAPPARGRERWQALLDETGFRAIAHARQVHGTTVAVHGALPPGVHIDAGAADGHATAEADVLLAVTVADCVPIYMVDPGRRVVALLHAGWRGISDGIMASGVRTLIERYGAKPAHLHVHLGPAICGRCYEVGPEVFEALGLPAPCRPAPADVRAVLVSRALALGVPHGHVTVSEQCTRCGSAGLFSHRGGRSERQAALLGIRL